MELPAGVLFVANTGAAAWLAVRWSRRLLPHAYGAERCLAGLVLFASLSLGSLLALGLANALSALSVMGLLGGLVLLDAVLGRRSPGEPSAAGAPPVRRWPLPALVIITLVCGWSAWEIVGSGTLFGFDTFTYHAVYPAWWIQEGSLSLVPINYQSYYPLNVELAALWYMLSHRIDANASLAMLGWLGILVAAFLVHARRLGHAPFLTATTLACFLLSPEIVERLPYYTSGDVAMAGVLLAMLAFTWIPTGVPTGDRRSVARAFLCGLAGGLAVGMKPNAAPYVILAGLAWTVRRRSHVGSPWFARLGSFGLGVLLMGGFWYLRNLILTGNPFFPAAIGPFDGPFEAEAQNATKLMPWIVAGWNDLEMWGQLFEEFLNWPLTLGLLSVAGFASAAWATFRDPDRARRLHLRLLLGSGLVFALLFPMQPFSGTVNRPNMSPIFLPRYVTFPFLIGLMLLPSAWAARGRRKAAEPAESPDHPPTDRHARGLPRAVVPLSGLVVLAGLAISTPYREAATTEACRKALGIGWDSIEELPAGTRLAIFTHDPPTHVPYYPLFGRKLQFRPVAVNLNGTSRFLLHERWQDIPPDWWWEFDVEYHTSGEQLMENLRGAGVQLLVLQNWPDRRPPRPFPLRHEITRVLGQERCFYSDETTEIWDLDGQFTGGGLEESRESDTPPEPVGR